MNRDKKALVSVIIPTFNNEATIDMCLSSLYKQSYSNIEIIIVDNHSQDNTRVIAQRYGKVYIKGPERSSQRNFGASQAKGDFFLFIDSDMEVTTDVINECVREALTKDIKAIIIPELSVGQGFWAKCKTLERNCYLNDNLIEAPRFFTKGAFLKAGGYDETLSAAEDWDLSLRIKKERFYSSRIESLIKHNEGKLSLRNMLKKKFIYGKNIHRYINKHREESKKQFVIIRPSFLKNYKQLLKHSILAIGMLIMKICEFSVGGCGLIADKFFPSPKLTNIKTSKSDYYMDTKVEKNWDADYRDRPPSLRLPGDTIKDQIIFNLVKKEDNKDGLLLELGCGLGYTASLLSRGIKVIGIDSSYEGVYHTSRRVKGHFICADARYLPFKERIFDFIVAKDIFEHFDDDILAFRELARVSKSKAKLISYLPHELKGLNFSIESIVKKCIGYTLDTDVGHIRRYTPQDVRRILSGLNFSVIYFWYFAHFVLGAIGLLGVSSYKRIKQKKEFFSPGKTYIIKLFFKVFELLARLECFIFKRIPGAGFFLVAQKH